MNKAYHLIPLLVVLLSGCSVLPDWMGGDNDKKLKGERFSVLPETQQTSPDPDANEIKVEIPDVIRSDDWTSSSFSGSKNGNLEGLDHYQVVDSTKVGHSPSHGYPLLTTPVVANDTLFAISAGGYVSARSLNNLHKELWGHYLLPNSEHSTFSGGCLVLSDGKLYATTGTEKVFALNATDGKVLWERSLSTPIRSAPSVDKTSVYVLSTDNKAYALRRENGSIIWTHIGLEESLGISSWASMVVNPETSLIIAPYSSGELFALRQNSGVEVWSDSISRGGSGLTASQQVVDIPVSPIVYSGKIYTLSHGGLTVAHDLISGNRLWEKDVSAQQAAWLAGDFLYMVDAKGVLLALHAPSGLIKWTKTLPEYENAKKRQDLIYWSNPILVNNNLIIIGSNGQMMTVSPIDGSLKSVDKVPSGIHGATIVVNKQIFYITDAAELIKLGAKK